MYDLKWCCVQPQGKKTSFLSVIVGFISGFMWRGFLRSEGCLSFCMVLKEMVFLDDIVVVMKIVITRMIWEGCQFGPESSSVGSMYGRIT